MYVRVVAAAAAPPRNKSVPIGGGGEVAESSIVRSYSWIEPVSPPLVQEDRYREGLVLLEEECQGT